MLRTKKKETKTVKIHSWDFDGMLCDKEYFNQIEMMIQKAASENRSLTHEDFKILAKNMIDHHKRFFDKRFGDKDDPNVRNVIMVGSNRQTISKDNQNAIKYPGKRLQISLSCYPFYAALAEVLAEQYPKHQISLEKALLEDVLHQKKAGSTFNEACQATYNGLDFAFISQLKELIDLAKKKHE